ncbi:ABC transporter permease [Amycolatopsis sp. YIM 10]|uniref:ABC transporter permease n=1 Tax=Amycolatopsis sp. YIM 10 TaxID=2653857 RepID=UPI0012905F18|nr:ABC transporter permease [Amycolatopsis sp. YIM 10]QFU94182.1 Macrolide export ATP-binding/permease protein MacB [Amycolatopsis sp. YIM 10]
MEVLRFAARGLTTNKLRSALTTLGITVGVAAVILLVAVGNGASAKVAESIEGLGTNVLAVTPARGPDARKLSTQDSKALVDPLGAPDVQAASPVVSTQATAVAGQTSYDLPAVTGTDLEYFTTTNRVPARGALFTAEDVTAARKVVVLGPAVAEELFGRADPVGQKVLLDGIEFTVVGVLAEKGSTGERNADEVAIAPLTAVQDSLTGYGSLDQIVVRAAAPDAVSLAQAEITAILTARLSDAEAFSVQNSAELLEASQSTTETFTVLLTAVAAISLLVGGIGVTNIMLVTVTERIREIGIRKAIGAPRAAILGQFLAEATLLSLFGGLLGVLLGVAGSRFDVAGITPVLVPSSIVPAFVVSALIGLFFGSYPAARAAGLRPIDALRHEEESL